MRDRRILFREAKDREPAQTQIGPNKNHIYLKKAHFMLVYHGLPPDLKFSQPITIF